VYKIVDDNRQRSISRNSSTSQSQNLRLKLKHGQENVKPKLSEIAKTMKNRLDKQELLGSNSDRYFNTLDRN
jgi:hypothetical protein